MYEGTLYRIPIWMICLKEILIPNIHAKLGHPPLPPKNATFPPNQAINKALIVGLIKGSWCSTIFHLEPMFLTCDRLRAGKVEETPPQPQPGGCPLEKPFSRGHLKRWFSKGIPPKSFNSGLGIILICPVFFWRGWLSLLAVVFFGWGLWKDLSLEPFF